MPGRFGFLPHARSAVASAAARDGARLTSAFDVKIIGDGVQQGAVMPMPATLRGPGDVVGIERNQIARWEPEPGQRGVEPNYFPSVEFVDTDFPWRFSLVTGNPNRLSPWLALLALTDEEFDLLDQGRAPLPRLKVHSIKKSLPNPAQAWAWAHVQVNLDDAGTKTAAEMLAEDPANGFARLFCCRKLAPRSRYHLFLVPLYEAGRLAGLGQRLDGTVTDTPAWVFGTEAPVELPYYAHSELTTDDGADIEQLVRKLRAFRADAPDEPGAPQRVSADHPGYYPGYTGQNQSFEVQTALVQANHSPEAYRPDPPLAKAMAATLTEVIKGEGDDPTEDPLVAFPPYGFRFRLQTDVSTSRATQGAWFDRLNLDLKMRQAAALGTKVVEANQEDFAKAAWDQYDSIMEANQKLRQLNLANQLAKRLGAKHLARLPSDLVTVLAEPLQPYVRTAATEGGRTISDTLTGAGSPGAYASRGLRRLASKRPVAAKTARGTERGTTVPAPSIKGDPKSRTAGTIKPEASPLLKDGRLSGDVAKHYTEMFGDIKIAPKPAKFGYEVQPVSTDAFSVSLRDTLDLLPKMKADFLIGGRSATEAAVPAPIWRSPRLPLPLADKLREVSRDAILSGVGDLPDNTVSLFTENRAFIEAFMVGANHAMNDELRWREFPTDLRGTLFDRFWDRGAALTDTASADITAIHTWTAKLGSNPNPANPNGNPALVIVIKGDIVRKLGDPVIVVNEGAGANWLPGRGRDYEPVFFGRCGREIAYYGFDLPNAKVTQNPGDYRLVIYEPIGRLRFGLDVGTAEIRRSRLPQAERSLPFAMAHRSADKRLKVPAAQQVAPPAASGLTDWDQLSWSHMTQGESGYINFQRNISTQNGPDLWGNSKTSASLARSFWQKPVAAVLPFSRVLP